LHLLTQAWDVWNWPLPFLSVLLLPSSFNLSKLLESRLQVVQTLLTMSMTDIPIIFIKAEGAVFKIVPVRNNPLHKGFRRQAVLFGTFMPVAHTTLVKNVDLRFLQVN
jgi:hypothetical protein